MFLQVPTGVHKPILGMIKHFTLQKLPQTSHFRGKSVTCYFVTMTFDCNYRFITTYIILP